MRYRVWIVIGVFILTIVILLGYTKVSVSQTNPIKTQQDMVSETTRYLQNGVNGHTIQYVNILYFKQVQDKKVIFASYKMDGKQVYSNILVDKNGIAIGTFSHDPHKGIQWESGEIGEESGFQVGGVVYNTKIQKMIIIFSNGFIAQAPVLHGYFVYFSTEPLPHRVFPKSMIGITEQGDIVTQK